MPGVACGGARYPVGRGPLVFGQMDSCHEGKYRVEITLSGEHLADIAYYELQLFQDGKLPWLRGARAHTGSSLETTLVEYVPDAIDRKVGDHLRRGAPRCCGGGGVRSLPHVQRRQLRALAPGAFLNES